MKKPILSVVIPTYNRIDALVKTLDSYKSQTILKETPFEVVIVDDGSTDGTEKTIKKIKSLYPFNIIYRKKEKNQGPASARNLGIKLAKGHLILITGDDVIATPSLFEEHLDIHKRANNIAVLGYTPWHQEIEITEFMKYILIRGHQFDYKKLKNQGFCDYGKFYTSNISLRKEWLKEELFDENFPGAAFEDVELGYRLTKKGLKIVFNKKAKAYHYHHIKEEEFYQKSRYSGRATVLMYKKHPEMKNMRILKIKTNIALLILSPIQFYNKIFNLFGLDKLRWKTNIVYHAASGIKYALQNENLKNTDYTTSNSTIRPSS